MENIFQGRSPSSSLRDKNVTADDLELKQQIIQTSNRVNSTEMSTERVSFGFNSLIPETYKTKAEAFAKCLQHKLLSLGKIDASTKSYGDSKRLSEQERRDNSTGAAGKPVSISTDRLIDKTDGSDEEFCSHSESENGDWSEQKQPSESRKQKLTSMSSEDSTVESWSSCQENLTDFEKLDSENEEVSNFASQIKGSPKLKSFNIRTKRKEIREKSWKRNSKKNHSSSTESIDSESIKEMPKFENFDSESTSHYILIEPDDDEVPHRILRESSSTSNLEKHFSHDEKASGPTTNGIQVEKDDKLLTPSGKQLNKTAEKENEEVFVNSRLQFAETESNSEEIEFVEVESMKDFSSNDIAKSVKKIGGIIVECSNDNSNAEINEDWCCDSLIITSVEVLDDKEGKQESRSQNEPEEANNGIEAPEDDEMLNSRSKMRRCSSLKTWKTPPGTPGGKKIVRFADALGLDLADVRTFLDEIPKIPSSAFDDLHFELPQYEDFRPSPAPTLIPLFQQPGTIMDFLERVQNQKICLESAIVTDVGVLTVTGYVRVQNMSFHKSVHVRYSLNSWQSFSDLQASYVPNSCDGFSDKFSFVLYGHTLKIGEKLEFALRLECCGAQYWDNNGGINYVFNCLPQTSASHFFSSFTTSQTDPWFDFY